MDYTELVQTIDEYYNKPVEEVQKELHDIIHTYKFNGMPEFCDKVKISKHTMYVLSKNHPKKPSFEIYARIKSVGANPNPRKPAIKQVKQPISSKKTKSLKEYNHDYYMAVTKKKREEKRKAKEGNSL